jgi:bifunctional DNA-binding transcriptional regulator/antitoxin component of YhaV-PrlF toxin-antitoxin module
MQDLDKKITAIVTTGGRITIPKPLRNALGWKPVCKIDMSIGPSGEVVLNEITSSPARQKAVAEAIARIVARRERLNLEDLTFRCLADDRSET